MIQQFYQQPFPVLDIDGDYFLREQTFEDTATFFNYYSDPDVNRYILATTPTSTTEASAEIHYCRSLFQQKRGIYWTIARKSDNRMVGAIGIYMNNYHHRGEISYDLDKQFWRQGIMSRALKCVIDYAVSHIGLHRLEALTVANNAASISILKKLGFQHEGTLRNYRYFQGKAHDVEMLATTPQLFNQHCVLTAHHQELAAASAAV